MRHIFKHILAAFVLFWGTQATFGQALSPLATYMDDNGEEQTIAAHEVTKALLGEDNVRIIRPFMSSEDFSEYLNRIPGAIIRVGIRDEEHQVSLHNQQMDFNDEVLPVAVSVVANMAVRRLEALAAR